VNRKLSIWIGYDPREIPCYVVCRNSIRRRLAAPIPVNGIIMSRMRDAGLYVRETQRRSEQLWDTISDAPMSTEFAITRFLTPHLAGSGLALFMDCDIMARESVMRLFDYVQGDKSKAVWCVKHQFDPPEGLKMDGQAQTRYARKNWSSVMLFDCDHPANKRLTVDMINTLPGRDLHRFCWLEDDEIGTLPRRWNFLVGHTELDEDEGEPALVHWTDGAPCMPGYEHVEYADEYRRELVAWAL
jgi:hypothetical protein